MDDDDIKKTDQENPSQVNHYLQQTNVNNDTTDVAIEENCIVLNDKGLNIATADKIGHNQELSSCSSKDINRNNEMKEYKKNTKKRGKSKVPDIESNKATTNKIDDEVESCSSNNGNNNTKKSNAEQRGKMNPENITTDALKKSVKLSYKYKKRPGTSALAGYSYKMKLLSLILYRSLNDTDIKEFVLGCSVDAIGSMNDVCFRFKTDTGKPAVVFIKIKYAENPDKLKMMMTNEDLENEKSPFFLLNCYHSFLSVVEKFNKEGDALFEGTFDDVDPYFIIYTPQRSNIDAQVVDPEIFAGKVYNTINVTGESQAVFKVNSTALFEGLKKETLKYIGKTIADFVAADNDSNEEVTDALIKVLQKYYHYLIPNVILITEQNGSSVGVFSDSFFNSGDKEHIILKNVLFQETLFNTKPDVEETKKNLYLLLERKIEKVGHISHLIGNVIAFNAYINKLEFTEKTRDQVPDFMKEKLSKIQITKSKADEAMDLAGRRIFKTIYFNQSKIKLLIAELDANRQNISSKCFEDEEKKAKQFLNKLYFYTNQGKEGDMSEKLKEEIEKNLVVERSDIFQDKPESVLLKFHQKVQKWWLLNDESYYLTNTCNFLKDVTNVIDSAFMSLYDFKCRYELDQFQLKFKATPTAEYLSKLDTSQPCITNILSDSATLTGIKLIQFFADKISAFFDFKHITHMKVIEFETLLEEIKKTDVENLVIIYESVINDFDKLKRVVDKFSKSTVIITKHKLTEDKAFQQHVKILNDSINLVDIENVNDILKYPITVQGIDDELEKFIEDKNLINAGIIEMILKNERVDVGSSLSTPAYEELEKYFVERKIRNDEFEYTESIFSQSRVLEYELRTFNDIEDAVVIITAKPGMGKSTLLTHLSVKNKSLYPKTWIVRMNLQDYSKEFDAWNETGVDFEESMRLVCKAQFMELIDKFSLEVVDSKLTLEKVDLEGTELLHLQLFVDSFNRGNVIFLFDGFDEICPYYETTVVRFMKELLNENSHQIWVTSRPYNAIKRTLTEQFTSPYYLRRLSTEEQTMFYQNYWEVHLKFEELSPEQLKNVDAFFEFMSQYSHNGNKLFKVPTSSVVPLRLMHEAAVDFLRGKVLMSPVEDKESLLNKWISRSDIQTIDDCIMSDIQYEEALHLAGIPLQMHIYANYFIGEITDTSSEKKWETGIHSSQFYEGFLETKFRTRFEEKNREEFYSSVNSAEYIKEKKKFTKLHKMLAFYAFFHDSSIHFKKVLAKKKWLKMINMIAKVQMGKEKTGFIDRIYRGVPRFVHLVFAEYFAVEFIADMLETQSDAQMRKLVDFLINCLLRSSVGLMTLFDHKIKNNADMRDILNKDATRTLIFTIWMEQDFISPDNTRMESSFVKVLENQLIETGWVFLRSIKGNLNRDNVESFIRFTARDLCILAVDFDGMIHYMLNVIRDVDASMIGKVISACDLHQVTEPTNEQILDHLRQKNNVAPFCFVRFGHGRIL